MHNLSQFEPVVVFWQSRLLACPTKNIIIYAK